MAEKALITPEVLRWARETAAFTISNAAGVVKVSDKKIQQWESGQDFPTIIQAQKLARAYRRPFSLFFLPGIPRDFTPLQDFRKKGSRPLHTSSLFIIREIQQKQSWISDLNRENKQKNNIVGRFTTSDKPVDVAADILSTLDINPLKYENKSNPILEWVRKVEAAGIFVSRTSFIHSRMTIDSEELQGFAIADPYGPFVFVNSSDWTAAQLFTLVHELVHIWIAETGISNYTETLNNDSKVNGIERFCNEVSGLVLIPDQIVKQIETKNPKSIQELTQFTSRLGVSSAAILIRSLKSNAISAESYRELKKEADKNFAAFQAKKIATKELQKELEKQGGPNYYVLLVNKNGRAFTQNVLDAYREGVIEPSTASSLLNVATNKFSKLEARMYG